MSHLPLKPISIEMERDHFFQVLGSAGQLPGHRVDRGSFTLRPSVTVEIPVTRDPPHRSERTR